MFMLSLLWLLTGQSWPVTAQGKKYGLFCLFRGADLLLFYILNIVNGEFYNLMNVRITAGITESDSVLTRLYFRSGLVLTVDHQLIILL